MTNPMITFHNFVNKPKIAHKSFTFTMAMSQLFPPSTLKRSNNYSGTLTLGDMTTCSFKTVWIAHQTKHQMPLRPGFSNHWWSWDNIQRNVFTSICFRIMELTYAATYATCTAYKTSSERVKTMWNVWQGLCNTPHWPYAKSTYLRHTRYLM